MEPLNEILKHVFVHYYEVVKKKTIKCLIAVIQATYEKKAPDIIKVVIKTRRVNASSPQRSD